MRSSMPSAFLVVCSIILLATACGGDSAEAHYNKGVAYELAGEYRLAIQEYDKAIELNPNFPDAYVSRGFAYDYLGEIHRAIEDYDKAIELDSNRARAYNNRGHSYYLLEDFRRRNRGLRQGHRA